MNFIEKAILIAVQKHAGQVDKAGKPYVLHPLRVMMKMRTEEEMIAAVLHDVIEDTDCTTGELRSEGFSESVIKAIDCLSKKENEDYADFIARVKQSPIALKVKIADIEDNMDVKRLAELTEKDVKRLNKYLKYREELIRYSNQFKIK